MRDDEKEWSYELFYKHLVTINYFDINTHTKSDTIHIPIEGKVVSAKSERIIEQGQLEE